MARKKFVLNTPHRRRVRQLIATSILHLRLGRALAVAMELEQFIVYRMARWLFISQREVRNILNGGSSRLDLYAKAFDRLGHFPLVQITSGRHGIDR